MKWAERQGWTIKLVAHCPLDATALPWLLRQRVAFEEVDLSGAPTDKILRFYQNTDLTLGMRGHAQMIPFGLGRPIISLISHDKLAWFLEDIHHTEWGVEMLDLCFEEKLKEMIAVTGDRLGAVREDIVETQRTLWRITQNNVRAVLSILK